MAKRAGSLLVDIALNTAKAASDVDKLNKKFNSFAKTTSKSLKKVDSAFGGIQRSIIGLASAYVGIRSIKALSTSFMSAATTTEELSIRFNTLLGSVEEGSRLFKDLTKFASGVPFEYEKIMDSAANLSGIMDRQQIMKWLPLIADLAAATGLTIDKTTEQVSRMLSAGAKSADLFRERGVLSMLGFQAGVSYSVQDTERMLMESWTRVDSKFKGVTKDLASSWTGATSMLKDQWFLFRQDVMKAGAFDYLKTKIKEVLDKILELREKGALEAWAKQMSEAIISGFKMAAQAAKIFAETISKIATLHDQFWGMVPESLGGGKSKMSLYEEKLKEYDKVVRLLQKKVQEKGKWKVGYSESAIEEEIRALQNKLKVIKAGLAFLDGQLNITLPEFPDASTIGSGASNVSAGAIGWDRRLAEMQGKVDVAEGWNEFVNSAGQIETLNRAYLANLEIADQFGPTYMRAAESALEFKDQQHGVSTTMSMVADTARVMEYGFSDAFTNLITGTGSVQDAFANMGRSIINVIADMIAKFLILNLLMKGLGLLFSATKGGGGGVVGDLGPKYDINTIASGMTFGHKGGLVTKHGIRQYHAGGAVMPLRADEVPAILQVGERVIPKDGAGASNVQVNLINNGTPSKVTQQTTRMDNRRMVVDLVMEDLGENPETGRRFAKLLPRR